MSDIHIINLKRLPFFQRLRGAWLLLLGKGITITNVTLKEGKDVDAEKA